MVSEDIDQAVRIALDLLTEDLLTKEEISMGRTLAELVLKIHRDGITA